MTNLIKLLGAIALIVLLLAIGPWLTIWAWNELSGALHRIDFNFWTWAAVIIMGAFFRANVTVKRRD